MEKATKELVEKYIGCEYEIHEDGSVSVFGDVYIYGRNLDKLPFKFRMVTGDFNCSDNQLTSLEGVPVSVGGDFDCCINRLTSLEGEPVSVGGNFNFSRNKLISLEGAPESIDGYFYCFRNRLTSLKGAPESVGGNFDCSNNNLNFSVDDYISRHNLERYEDGFIVYKRVSHDFKTQEDTDNETLWLPGTTVKIPFWDVSEECGAGKFHACFDTKHCNFFRMRRRDKYIKIKVLKEDIHVFSNPKYLEKIAFQKGFVIEEVK